MKALVVDDSRTMRMTVRKLLESMKYDVVEAENGQEALDRLQENQGEIGLVMLDWNMPVMNGLDCLKSLREDTSHSHVKVIMLTTENQLEAIRTAIMQGANEYIMKPFTEEMLVEKVNMVLPNGGEL